MKTPLLAVYTIALSAAALVGIALHTLVEGLVEPAVIQPRMSHAPVHIIPKGHIIARSRLGAESFFDLTHRCGHCSMSIHDMVIVDRRGSPGSDTAAVYPALQVAPPHEGRTPGIAGSQPAAAQVELYRRPVIMTRALAYTHLTQIGTLYTSLRKTRRKAAKKKQYIKSVTNIFCHACSDS